MDATELRIDNIVTINNAEHWPHLKGIPMRVKKIVVIEDYGIKLLFRDSKHKVGVKDSNGEIYNQIEQFIEGVPLNKDNILKIEGFLKFALETHELGIKNYQLRFTGKSGTNHLITIRFIDDKVYAWLDENKVVIEYMHDIQNIYFWFTKQEIKIYQL